MRISSSHRGIASGLLCYLLDIQSPAQLLRHPARGLIFESWVASELLKARFNGGLRTNLSFYRDRSGLEVDLIARDRDALHLVEVKSGQTAAADAFAPLDHVAKILRTGGDPENLRGLSSVTSTVVYGGQTAQHRSQGRIVPWRHVGTLVEPGATLLAEDEGE